MSYFDWYDKLETIRALFKLTKVEILSIKKWVHDMRYTCKTSNITYPQYINQYVEGRLHCEDGPACVRIMDINPNKSLFRTSINYIKRLIFNYNELKDQTTCVKYYINGELHRDDGPAVIFFGSYIYFKHGIIHRDDGPAIFILANDIQREYWWVLFCSNIHFTYKDAVQIIEYNNGYNYKMPAILKYFGHIWVQNGKLYRSDGFAVNSNLRGLYHDFT
jgi:hypothetical protein